MGKQIIILILLFIAVIPNAIAQTNFNVQLSDDELLTKVQQHTFKYFWDYADANSGMAYERIPVSGKATAPVTTGGTGFGVMAVLVGVERGFITREQGVERITKIVDFLQGKATDYKGVFAHWINPKNGETQSFSEKDNGGDLVETSFLMQGLITARQYFNQSVSSEQDLVTKINALWHNVDWNFFRFGSTSLYWHCSNDLQNVMNMKVAGWNECLITYLLAIASPTHSVNASLWKTGWSKYQNLNKTYYGITLPIGEANANAKGGPLFFTHYSFMGFDPRNLKDTYNNVNYFFQNEHQTRINREYCEDNPLNYVGYGKNKAWGLTACDGYKGEDAVSGGGYSAHSPGNDRGNIAPTAALSSMPYTPEESMEALHYFYYTLGPEIWNDKCGFVDAFNETKDWEGSDYLAIDQGPIICMIENYRTGLLWKYFMSAPEIQTALQKIGFVYDEYPKQEASGINEAKNSKNTLSVFQKDGEAIVCVDMEKDAKADISSYNLFGQKMENICNDYLVSGRHCFTIHASKGGVYVVNAIIDNEILSTKIFL